MSKPLVTVNILSYNRKEELRLTLKNVFEQDYKNIEVIVVDNASTDGSSEMVKTEFPNLKLISLENNIGIAAYKYSMDEAKGEYFLILDDDSYPNKGTLQAGVSFLERNSEYGIVTFKIYNRNLNEVETRLFKSDNPYLFHGCGSLWRKQIYEELGGYDPDYFLYYNELDLTIRCYDNNIKIKYLSDNVVYHQNIHTASKNLGKNYHQHKKKYEQYFTGHIRFLIKHFDFKYIILYTFKWIINRFLIAVFYNYYASFFKSIIILPKVIYESSLKRKPVRKEIQNYYRNGNIPFIDRDFFPKFRKPFIKR